jgi:hypothetical protein
MPNVHPRASLPHSHFLAFFSLPLCSLLIAAGFTLSPVIKKALKTEESDFLSPCVQVSPGSGNH